MYRSTVRCNPSREQETWAELVVGTSSAPVSTIHMRARRFIELLPRRPRHGADVADHVINITGHFRSPGTFAPRLPSHLGNLQEKPVSDQTDLIQGTLDLLLMRTIALEPMHG